MARPSRAGRRQRRSAVSHVTDSEQRPARHTKERLTVVAFTSRPTVNALFSEIGRRADDAVAICLAPLEAGAVEAAGAELGGAGVAVVDASVDRAEAIVVCEAIHGFRPGM